MALSELAAIEAAYHALQSLDEAGRGRALRWLSDALDAPMPLAETAAEPAAATAAVGAPAALAEDGARPGRRSPAAGGRGMRQSGRRPAPAEGTRVTRRKSEAPAGRRGRRRADAATGTAGERVYRRMPAPDEVMAAYQQVGTVSGLAQHFGVPVHTAQGWARRLRQKGHQIGRREKE
ncbi:MAG TPA: hypothetical protein VFR67_31075 [Pilimelia sp.]|nr:hypothetical protein [Pilimelia sp.]